MSVEESPYSIAAFYKFVHVETPTDMEATVQRICEKNGLQGTVIVGTEGVNGTISGTKLGVEQFMADMRAIPCLHDIVFKLSAAKKQPFYRLKVDTKSEIVKLGIPGVKAWETTGTLVEPSDWNELIQRDDVVLVDTRNEDEVSIGTFEGASDPKTTTFTEFPQFVTEHLEPLKQKKKVAMFCTGGIRCEKASAYMLQNGWDEVYQLHGGILKYLEEVKEEKSKWKGECFVFDSRVSVGHGLVPGKTRRCHSCRALLTEQDLEKEEYTEGISCHQCCHKLTEKQLQSRKERQRQVDLARQKGTKHHIGSQRTTELKPGKTPKKAKKEPTESDPVSQ
eukprot:TRINITY_DN60714_c0_g1_i1.p1 TRINITY_DN60714_c0_g1~~TRINITY_DN60714_c0_g1_i1.p1  ORF type:complete len:336 (-),score=31.51 TRINITY_DN60714_c0_g1_i1:175-1182(-)